MTVELEAPPLYFAKTCTADPETGTDFSAGDDGKGWRQRLMNAERNVLANLPLRVLSDDGTRVVLKGEGHACLAGRVALSQITMPSGDHLPMLPVIPRTPDMGNPSNVVPFVGPMDIVPGHFITTDCITITWTGQP